MGELYFNNLNVVDKNGNSYCVDMLRMRCNISMELFERRIGSRLFLYKDKLEMWDSTRISEFWHNYHYTDEDAQCSFWFGFVSNKEKNFVGGSGLRNEKRKFNLTVEFNPNKVKDNKLLLYILSCSSSWCVKSVDFAVDVKTNILNVIGFDKSRKDCLMTYDCGGDDKTFYLGKGNNRVKVYNKTKECGLDYDLTRIEITRYFGEGDPLEGVAKHWYYYGYFPELFLNDFQISFEDLEEDKTLLGLVYAVCHGLALHDLSRVYRDKVKEFLKNKNSIDVDLSCFAATLRNYLYYYFPFLKNK